jgi:hypothetical protein
MKDIIYRPEYVNEADKAKYVKIGKQIVIKGGPFDTSERQDKDLYDKWEDPPNESSSNLTVNDISINVNMNEINYRIEQEVRKNMHIFAETMKQEILKQISDYAIIPKQKDNEKQKQKNEQSDSDHSEKGPNGYPVSGLNKGDTNNKQKHHQEEGRSKQRADGLTAVRHYTLGHGWSKYYYPPGAKPVYKHGAEVKPDKGYGPDAESTEEDTTNRTTDGKAEKKENRKSEIIVLSSSDSESYVDANEGVRRSSRESIPTDTEKKRYSIEGKKKVNLPPRVTLPVNGVHLPPVNGQIHSQISSHWTTSPFVVRFDV